MLLIFKNLCLLSAGVAGALASLFGQRSVSKGSPVPGFAAVKFAAQSPGETWKFLVEWSNLRVKRIGA